MKIRTGFVSNSSSSSFIVAFKNFPKTAEEMKQIIFGDSDKPLTTYCERHDYAPIDVAKILFEDATRVSRNPSKVEMQSVAEADDNADLEDFLKRNKGRQVRIFHYSDEDGGLGTILEHYTFRECTTEQIDFIDISQH